jgi:septal ring factor EnvC (AmiA/AmiB activator)
MNKDKKIERLEKQLADAKSEVKQLKSEVRKTKSDKNEKSKKRRQDSNVERRARTVVVEPVRGHRFSELAIRLSTVIYSNMGCGLRSVVKLLEIIDDTLM